MAESLRISARNRYILHSGSSDVPSRAAKRIVAKRPSDDCSTESRIAVVGEEDDEPTPTDSSTARDASSDAIDDEKACRES